jgi:hypothetical protein
MSGITSAIGATGVAASIGGTIISATAQKGTAAAQRDQAAAQEQLGEIQADNAIANANTDAQFYRYRGDLSDFNVTVDQLNSIRILAEGDAQADIIQRATTRALGRTQAAFSASGVTTDNGSPLMVMHDQAAEAMLQKHLTLYGAQVGSDNMKNQATIDETQGAIYRALATNSQNVGNEQALAFRNGATVAAAGSNAAATASDFGAGTTLLTGAASALKSATGLFPSSPSTPGVIPKDYTTNAGIYDVSYPDVGALINSGNTGVTF